MRCCVSVFVLILVFFPVRSRGGDPPPASPPPDLASIEKKIAELERQIAELRKEIQDLRLQAAPKAEGNPQKTESSVAWGKATKGLQAGLRYSSSKIAIGEQLTMEVFVANVGDETIKVSYVEPSAFLGHLKEGNQLILGPVGRGRGFETTCDLAPGKELSFGIALLLLPPHPAASPARPWLEIEAGKYRVSSPNVLMRRDGSHSNLATGIMDLEVVQPLEKKP
jgi:hypothetical protein